MTVSDRVVGDPNGETVPDLPSLDGSRLTVVIPSYNGRELLDVMLASLERQTLRPARIVVVDDCSDDDTIEHLRAHWPGVDVIELPRRGGVTAALNECLRVARTELVGLFNNDMELDAGCLAELVAELDRHPEAASATPKMLDFSARETFDGAGDLLVWRGGATRRGHGEVDHGQYDQPEDVFGACGGSAVYRRSALDRVGYLYEPYFAYYEDVDWAFRAQLAGLRCRYAAGAILYHRGSATLGQGLSDFNGYHLWRNPIWLVARCYPGRALLHHAPSLLLGQLGNLYTAARARRLHVWARAMRDAVRGLPAALEQRGEIQRKRVISVAELEAVVRAGRR